ncbi:cytochrome P450 monooxygenase [Podospora aff. communis PSN243]|uniref:Cytochrome P450 monooxygenase n=1 Tax=Podospora aff. communis PSN243 TaxID=3040156 RepID=A0AAV9G583_9PEZI|nr:cytochrome P450 monooxygenase [Podospora aff. communis PSN243]
MAAGYTGKDLGYHSVEAAVDRTVLSLVRMIENRYIAKKKPFDLGRKAQYYTLDVIADLGYGEPFGFVSRDEDRFDYLATTEKTFAMFLSVTIYPWVYDILSSRVFKFLLPTEKDRTGFGKLMGIAKEKAAERFGPDRKIQGDMLGSFVAHGLSQEDAESEILLQLIASSDTTSTAIRAILLLIITTPRVYAPLLSEIAAATSSLRDDEVISNERAQKMTYLQAVIKEGMRWHPPVAGMISKKVPAAGDEWKGVTLPPGIEFWGEDAGEFRPERWLGVDAARLKAMEATLDLTFGSGRLQCLGKNVAALELNKVFVELLRRFELSVVDPTNPWSSTCANIFLVKDFWLKAEKRKVLQGA